MNDPLGDMLTRIRNAQQRRRPKVSSPASKLRERVLDVLQSEGYIRGYARIDHKNGPAEFEIELKYANGQPAIREIKRISKPGRRVYTAVRELTTVANGLGVAILSTPKGVMSDTRAREENVGGEILCNVF
ncbi:MAG: 30S ribosomal protein S8 [Hyphomicrobiaceae bacterium]|jgi:small subunit ribosomal protein S8|nr:MAG: 30S ribosomal protein S8 [Hyphomicrobiaceae bacterium]HEU0060720.1 30S ribosomal protein S8 [Hyphomicrobiaceae bacterium]HEX2336947.1 30S ribosomal protein S8 [Hyphomicrobiaceae bacterium]